MLYRRHDYYPYSPHAVGFSVPCSIDLPALMLKKFALALALLFGLAVAFHIRADITVEDLKPTYAPPPSQFLLLDEMEVHFRDEGTGPALVLLHGTGASLHTWDGWAEALTDSFRVIRLDLPGFGLTGPHPLHDYQIDTYVHFLCRFLEKRGVERFHLAGNSLGGQIAWTYVLHHPEQVDKLILLDPAGYPGNRGLPLIFRMGQTPGLNTMLRHVTPRFLIERNLRDVYANDVLVTPELVDRYYALALRQGNRDAFIARTQVVQEDRFAQLGQITQPTLLLWGEQDTWIPASDAAHFVDKLPNATLITYPNVGHVPMEELPKQTAADARRFLRMASERG